MENFTRKNILRTTLIILAMIFIQSCSSVTPVKKITHVKKKKPSARNAKYTNFDRKKFPNDATVISNMISVVQPEMKSFERESIAASMSKALKKNKIEPQIMVAIIDTESDFKHNKVSTTGDLSLAQINVEVWNKEFVRMNRKPIDKSKLKLDVDYAMTKMAEILKIIKNRFAHKDSKWYARYHSGTTQYKNEYLQKLDIRLRMLAKSPVLNRPVPDHDNRIAQAN